MNIELRLISTIEIICLKFGFKDGYVHHCGDFCKSDGCIFSGHDMVHAIDGINLDLELVIKT